ncbi:hypothetical protein [Sphingomonas humi]|uniref:Uncharacterized protein n=1 Tax=Sphingomonas humi TaxID=335630 RepID=A0ABP7RFI1_9SPHN
MANAGINAALIAVASQQQHDSDDLTKQLRAKGATSVRTAASIDLSASGAAATLRSLVKQGYVRDAGGGPYWLDEEHVVRAQAAVGRFFLILLAFLISLGASLWAINVSS